MVLTNRKVVLTLIMQLQQYSKSLTLRVTMVSDPSAGEGLNHGRVQRLRGVCSFEYSIASSMHFALVSYVKIEDLKDEAPASRRRGAEI